MMKHRKMEKLKATLTIEILSINELINPPEELSIRIKQLLNAMNEIFTEDSIIIDYNGRIKTLGEL